MEKRAEKTQANVAALQATTQREHRHREHRHRSSRQPTDSATPSGANGSPLILTPASAQLKDRDRSRRHANPGRELSMSVQPLAPNSRINSHRGDRSERTDKEKDVNTTTHPYASATATPTTPSAGVPLGATYQRTTSNSPLPPLPGGADESGARMSAVPASASQGALGAYPNGMTSQPTLSRGMSVPRMDGLGYAGQQAGQHIDDPPKRGGLLSILCCR